MKLSEIRGEDAMEVLADILEPAGTIMADKEVANGFRSDRMKTISMILRKYKKEVIQVLAATERKDVKEYEKEVNVLTLPVKLLEIFNDEELMSFFSQPEQTTSGKPSGSATESTEAKKNIS